MVEMIKRIFTGLIVLVVAVTALVFFVQNPADVANGVKTGAGWIGDAASSIKTFAEVLSQ